MKPAVPNPKSQTLTLALPPPPPPTLIRYAPEAQFGRSVCLFNTWLEAPTDVCILESDPPPILESDPPPNSDPPQGISTETAALESIEEGGLKGSAARAENLESSRAEPRDTWREAPQRTPTGGGHDNGLSAKVWLLGDQARRGIAERTVKVAVEGDLPEALAEEELVSFHTVKAVRTS